MVLTRSFISEGAARHGDRLAVVSARGRASYADLDLRSDRLAGVLGSRGVKAGDRVVLFMDDSLEAVIAIVAVLKAGAILVPVPSDAAVQDLAYVFDDCRAAAIFTEARLGVVAAEAMRLAGAVRLVVLAGGDQGSVSDSCIAFEDAVGRNARAATTAAAPMPPQPPLMLVYPRVRGGLGAPVTLTDDDVLPASGRAAAMVGAVVQDIEPTAGGRGVVALLAALAEGATIMLPAQARLRRAPRASAA
jgi:long-chain acyl-CoA synthetase